MHIDPTFRENLDNFDLEALDRADDVIYGVDEDKQLAFFNEGWQDFAVENGADEAFFSDWGIGARVDHAFGDELAEFYFEKFEQTRQTGEPWEHDYECSGPVLFRKFRMRILPLEAGGWLVIHSLVVERPREPSDQFEPDQIEEAYRDSDDFYYQCSHCGRFRRPDGDDAWDWVPQLVEDTPSHTSHGLCSTCFDYYYGAVG